jgi:GntR family transcriptional regulator, galactonate operon transcriptional repressor
MTYDALPAPATQPLRIRRRGIHSDVVRELGLRIVAGEYAPGVVLPRSDIWAEELGVSRTVVREVTRVLAEKGLVESRQRSGTRVRPRSEWNLVDPEVIAWQRQAGPDLQFFRDLSDVRVAIESTAARLAAERATSQEVAEMRAMYERMEREIGDPVAYAAADLDLHAAILRATHNALLAQLTHAISEGLVASRDVTVRSPGASARSMPLHAGVVDAIAARDGDLAASCMKDLVERAIRDIESILGRRSRKAGAAVAGAAVAGKAVAG